MLGCMVQEDTMRNLTATVNRWVASRIFPKEPEPSRRPCGRQRLCRRNGYDRLGFHVVVGELNEDI